MHSNCRCRMESYSLLKLRALEPLKDRRVSISNQSRKRVSLRGEEVPACCYLCWGSALVTEALLLQAVTTRSPGKLFIPATGSSPTAVGSGGSSLRQPGRRGERHRRKRQERQWQGRFCHCLHCGFIEVTHYCLSKVRVFLEHYLSGWGHSS